MKSTNMLERLNQEIKRRTLVVRIFPNNRSGLRLVSALAVDTHEDWLQPVGQDNTGPVQPKLAGAVRDRAIASSWANSSSSMEMSMTRRGAAMVSSHCVQVPDQPKLSGASRASLPNGRFHGIDVLGPRLLKCTALVNQVRGRSAYVIFGSPDDMKFHSSMTLFAMADPIIPEFQTALEKYFGGEMDKRTVEMLG